jgi:hypothetical protein
MILKTKKYFLLKKANQGDIEATFELLEYQMNNRDFELFHDVGKTLKNVLVNVHPEKSMWIYAKVLGKEFTLESMRSDYMHLVTLIAVMHFDCKEYDLGIFWARKSMDLFDYFHIKLNKATRDKLKLDDEDYKSAAFYFDKGKDYFDADFYKREKGIPFVWEENCYFSKKPTNDNIKN